MWAKKVENYVAGVHLNVRAMLLCAAESLEEMESESTALNVSNDDNPNSAEIDAQLFLVLRS